jgi:hypothetical protein
MTTTKRADQLQPGDTAEVLPGLTVTVARVERESTRRTLVGWDRDRERGLVAGNAKLVSSSLVPVL